MAALTTFSLKLPVKPPPMTRQPDLISHTRLLPSVSTRSSPFHKTLTLSHPRRLQLIKALEEKSEEAEVEFETKTELEASSKAEADATDVGAEIKKAMEERKRKEEEGESLFSGVAEEIREIEWPAFGKVLGTTGVVLGVIAGSSVVLLTVNFVLAELSDRVFAGKGLQDIFG